MKLGLLVPPGVPTAQGRGWPTGAGAGDAGPRTPALQLRTCNAVTWAVEPLLVTVVMRNCSTPGKGEPRVGTLQPVAWLLSRSIRISKVLVVADAAGAKPSVSSSTAKAILAVMDFKKFIGKLLGRNASCPSFPEERTGHDGRPGQRLRTASRRYLQRSLCQEPPAYP